MRGKKLISTVLTLAMVITLGAGINSTTSVAEELSTDDTVISTEVAGEETTEVTTTEDVNEIVTEDINANGDAISLSQQFSGGASIVGDNLEDETVMMAGAVTDYPKISTLANSATTLTLGGAAATKKATTTYYRYPYNKITDTSISWTYGYGAMFKLSVPAHTVFNLSQYGYIYIKESLDICRLGYGSKFVNDTNYTQLLYIWVRGTSGSNITLSAGNLGLDASVAYKTQVQTYGWQGLKKDGETSGTLGLSKRLETIAIAVSGNDNIGIQYTTHVQSYGWLPWVSDGYNSGTEGESKRLEAIKIQLTGADKDGYDIYYRVHAQSYGWLDWAKNGAPAGTAGYGKRLEAIEIKIVSKGSPAPGATAKSYVTTGSATVNVPNANVPTVMYETHVQSYGWQSYKYSGMTSGTMGKSKRLEAIFLKLTNTDMNGSIEYRTHIQSYGWESTWSSDGEKSGTYGQGKRLEAIQIRLTDDLAANYDIYYRVHAQTYGWLGWAKNGQEAGTAGYSKRLEGIQVVIVPKGAAAPGSTANCYIAK